MNAERAKAVAARPVCLDARVIQAKKELRRDGSKVLLDFCAAAVDAMTDAIKRPYQVLSGRSRAIFPGRDDGGSIVDEFRYARSDFGADLFGTMHRSVRGVAEPHAGVFS